MFNLNKSIRVLISVYTAFVMSLGLPIASGEDNVGELRERVVNARSDTAKSQAYEALFRNVGLDGLEPLTLDADMGIALQANWEAHKILIKRAGPIEGRTDWIYDRAEMNKFVDALQKITHAPVPD